MKHLFAPRIASVSYADDAGQPKPDRTVDNRVQFAAKYRRHVLNPRLIQQILGSSLPEFNRKEDRLRSLLGK